MTDPVLSLAPDQLSVQPGGQGRVVVTITNPGTIVEGYRVDIVDEVSTGDGRIEGPRAWAEVLPSDGPDSGGQRDATVSVYPQQQQDVVVVFSPGTGPQVPGGSHAFGVRVVSAVDPSNARVVEGEVEIGQVLGLQAKLVPVTSSGRWAGRHVLRISNWGNAPARLRLTPSDPDQALGYLVRPEVVDVPLGGSVTARIKVRTRHPRLRGQVSRLPFSIVADPDPPVVRPGPLPGTVDGSRPVVDGVFNQRPIVSRLVVGAAALVVIGALAVAGLAFLRKSPEPTVAEFGVPPTPVLAAAVPASASEIKLAWAPVPNVSGYQLLQLSPGSNAVEASQKLDKAIGAHPVKDLDPGTEYCFQLQTLRGDVASPKSAKQCAKTKPAPDSVTPSVTPSGGSSDGSSGGPSDGSSGGPTGGGQPSQSFAATDWLAELHVAPSSAPLAQQNIQADQASLVAKKIAAKVLFTGDYPHQTTFKVPSWMVYLGPFPSSAQATAACQQVKSSADTSADCLPFQPGTP